MADERQLISPFMVHLGIDIVSMQGGKAEVAVTLLPELLNSGGMAHGGLIATLADGAAGAAVFSVMARDKMAVTTDFNLTCLKSTAAGLLTAKGEVIHQGRRLIRADVEVFSDSDLVAKAGVSFMVIERPVPSES
ncbi:PaaI family thioesterase [Oceanicoccus sagamiensis]|uniref:Thioesterase domain-containing protein n=1 Tax=Oceanicoccus sagamiensis TaxID=716816 RepID=A0A1X9NJT3_9GAMM|nr:PaaI family thioesterase [Oceanicoccus sagamiensis]ARN76095.1 hypothetical protein BST96_19535 [Oceanicoccus sagamiensis]